MIWNIQIYRLQMVCLDLLPSICDTSEIWDSESLWLTDMQSSTASIKGCWKLSISASLQKEDLM